VSWKLKTLKSPSVDLQDDTMVTQMLGRRILEGAGYSVEVASNGAEALDKWETRPYHLVLMDIEMEVMDGYTATKHIRAAEALQGRPRTPIVALTAHDSIDIEAKNMDDLLTRPVLKDALLKMVKKWTPGVGSPVGMHGQFARTPPPTPPAVSAQTEREARKYSLRLRR
jgi:CheY-like chemotaxis protein